MLLDTPYAELSQEPVVVVKDKQKHGHCSVVIESPDQMCYQGLASIKEFLGRTTEIVLLCR